MGKTKPKKSKRSVAILGRRAIVLKKQLAKMGAIYAEIDQIIDSMLSKGSRSVTVDGHTVSVVSNFDDKNTIWRSHAIRHFEIKISKKRGAK